MYTSPFIRVMASREQGGFHSHFLYIRFSFHSSFLGSSRMAATVVFPRGSSTELLLCFTFCSLLTPASASERSGGPLAQVTSPQELSDAEDEKQTPKLQVFTPRGRVDHDEAVYWMQTLLLAPILILLVVILALLLKSRNPGFPKPTKLLPRSKAGGDSDYSESPRTDSGTHDTRYH